MLSDTVQCKHVGRERFLGSMTDQDDAGRGGPGRDTSDDGNDGASVKKERRRSHIKDFSSSESSGR